MAKSNYIHIRVSEDQKHNIRLNAEKNNQSITEYVLQSINNLAAYNNLVDYIKEKMEYYNSISDLELANVYLDLFFKLRYKHF